MKKNNTWIGRKAELYAHAYVLPGSILETNKNRNVSFDITWEGYRINVKAAQLRNFKHGNRYVFTLHLHHEQCDFFLLMGYKNWRDRDFSHIWLIPSDLLRHPETKEYLRWVTIGAANKGRFKDYIMTDYQKRGDKRNAA